MDFPTVSYDPNTLRTTGWGKIAIYHLDSNNLLDYPEVIIQGNDKPAPYGSTYIVPPVSAPPGHVSVFDPVENKWSFEEDHRGLVVYSKATGAGMKITTPGPISDEYTLTPSKGGWYKWDDTTSSWVLDPDARRTGLQQQAQSLLSGEIANITSWMNDAQLTLGPKYLEYKKNIALIALGKFPDATALPEPPEDPTT